MTNDDDHKVGGVAESDGAKTEREAAAKAVLDNMARLRALRLAREAAMPQSATSGKTQRARTTASTTKRGAKKAEDDKPRPLSEWLADQQSSGRRT
ncbi:MULTISPECIES: hypothetical protein [Rhodopseudomonas]|uniref:Uncharacterized protein n=1 Tax=Rhodopseudomonas palustris (strain DX-1) TaxID=652103 RepID=E6VH31_RHOPX|nr:MULTISPECIES: hypothetical protein [Rhodopseudomonas]NEW88085.1 hypothetical protein [Rhodopseudomonas sp. WA056]QDL99992.1 hypothetical protein FLL57_22920 [Rhodopseudomonas palustris]